MRPLTLCPWKHWFWITTPTKQSKTMANHWSTFCWLLMLSLCCRAQWTSAAPVGAVDAKSITFKRLALNDGAPDDKPGVAAASMVSAGRRGMRVPISGINDSPEDAIGEVMNGQEEIRGIFVTLPTTASTSTVETVSLSTTEPAKEELPKVDSAATVTGESVPEVEKEDQLLDNVKKEELSSAEPIKLSSPEESQTVEGTTTVARIVQVSTNGLDEQKNANNEEIPVIPGMSIEDSEKKIDNQNIQNLILQEEDVLAEVGSIGSNRSRKSKGLTEKSLLPRSTDEEEDEAIEPSNPEARQQPAAILNSRSLIQFSDNDRRELQNSQNHALTSDDMTMTRSSNLGLISGIGFSVLTVFCAVSLVGAMMYRRRYINKPQTLSEPDTSGYIDDSIIRENSDEMYSLDNDSFLNSLEAMTIQNYWTDHVKHTKL